MNITLQDIHFAYGTTRSPVFHGFSMSINPGLTILKGYSGCGKTTLLRLAAGLLKPSSGTVQRTSQPLLVLQEDALLPWLTVRDNFIKFNISKLRDRVPAPLWTLVHELLPLHTYRLSYGQRRIAELTRAVAFAPNILFLDEPFNYLDDSRVHVAIDALLAYLADKRTLVITTHRHDTTLDEAGKVLQFDGTPPFSELSHGDK